ncbi:MAG: sugar transporter [Planctomycetaceae bacterium]|nr:sugar transporter [Planctomycetaceae bacterium]
MRIVQIEIPRQGRRVGVVEDDSVLDLTSVRSDLTRVHQCFSEARAAGSSLNDLLAGIAKQSGVATLSYEELWAAAPGGDAPWLCAPVDHEDVHHVFVTGTGLTHTGSMQSRDQMHAEEDADKPKPDSAKTDSAKMFEMGLEGGKPADGQRGVAPEWFYKGTGVNLRGHRESLDVPSFALDGGEEPEIAGIYIIGEDGQPYRLGFALGNEWSDHPTEKINYLYLAPSKLRTCSIGPELNTDIEFDEIRLQCTVMRDGQPVYQSGELLSGETFMSHTLANREDHHFKYPLHRQPGDIHIHYFGTSKLSYGTRDWKYQTGDEIQVSSDQFGQPLINTVAVEEPSAVPVRVALA